MDQKNVSYYADLAERLKEAAKSGNREGIAEMYAEYRQRIVQVLTESDTIEQIVGGPEDGGFRPTQGFIERIGADAYERLRSGAMRDQGANTVVYMALVGGRRGKQGIAPIDSLVELQLITGYLVTILKEGILA